MKYLILSICLISLNAYANPWQGMPPMYHPYPPLPPQNYHAPPPNMGFQNFNNTMNQGTSLAVRQYETETAYIIDINIKGGTSNDVLVKVADHRVTLKSNQSQSQKQQGKGSYQYSYHSNYFTQTLSIPKNADINKMKMDKTKNSIKLTFPRKI